MSVSEPLAEEVETFERQREQLLERHKGKFVLIKGQRVVDVFPTTERAFQAGIKEFGLDPFLIRQVTDEDRAVHVVFSSRETDGGPDCF